MGCIEFYVEEVMEREESGSERPNSHCHFQSYLKKSLLNFSSESELWSRSDAVKGEGEGGRPRSTLRRFTSVKIRPISQMLESSLF